MYHSIQDLGVDLDVIRLRTSFSNTAQLCDPNLPSWSAAELSEHRQTETEEKGRDAETDIALMDLAQISQGCT